MATATNGCTTEKHSSVVRSYGQQDSMQRLFMNEMFPVYGGKYMSRKAVHSWVQKRGKRFADDEDVETEWRKRLRQQSKDFYAAGFDDALVKRQDKWINVDGGYAEK
jgi:hypothetical protein